MSVTREDFLSHIHQLLQSTTRPRFPDKIRLLRMMAGALWMGRLRFWRAKILEWSPHCREDVCTNRSRSQLLGHCVDPAYRCCPLPQSRTTPWNPFHHSVLYAPIFWLSLGQAPITRISHKTSPWTLSATLMPALLNIRLLISPYLLISISWSSLIVIVLLLALSSILYPSLIPISYESTISTRWWAILAPVWRSSRAGRVMSIIRISKLASIQCATIPRYEWLSHDIIQRSSERWIHNRDCDKVSMSMSYCSWNSLIIQMRILLLELGMSSAPWRRPMKGWQSVHKTSVPRWLETLDGWWLFM